jgi:[ribosomal protein S18]-alanine N-acetyltransferase
MEAVAIGEITVRPMQESDLDDVLAIEEVCFPAPWSRKMFRDELLNPAAQAFIFEKENKPFGFMIFWAVLDEAHLMTIAIHPKCRGRGYGTRIMEFLEQSAHDLNVKKILLEVARANTSARTLYKNMGFTSIGFRRKYYLAENDDAIVMEKWIGTEEEKSQPDPFDT